MAASESLMITASKSHRFRGLACLDASIIDCQKKLPRSEIHRNRQMFTSPPKKVAIVAAFCIIPHNGMSPHAWQLRVMTLAIYS
jgi:hypothetical protein